MRPFCYLAFTSDGEFPFFVRAMDISSSTLVFIHFCLQFGSFSFWLLYFELVLCFVELGFYDDEVDIFFSCLVCKIKDLDFMLC